MEQSGVTGALTFTTLAHYDLRDGLGQCLAGGEPHLADTEGEESPGTWGVCRGLPGLERTQQGELSCGEEEEPGAELRCSLPAADSGRRGTGMVSSAWGQRECEGGVSWGSRG